MIKNKLKRNAVIGVGIVGLLVAMGTPASALDGYQDRRGLFWGFGVGGGGAFPIPDGNPGGAILMDLQLGGGATQNLTLDFDVDFWVHIMDGYNNLFITPGPEVNYFFGDTGLFARAGVGMAMDVIFVEDDTEFEIGFDAGLGLGWEFFVNSNLALGVAAEADYVVIKGDDVMTVGFVFGLRYY